MKEQSRSFAFSRVENQDESEGHVHALFLEHTPRLHANSFTATKLKILRAKEGKKKNQEKKTLNEITSTNQCDLQTATPGSVCSTQ
jgi:hypothetical protein